MGTHPQGAPLPGRGGQAGGVHSPRHGAQPSESGAGINMKRGSARLASPGHGAQLGWPGPMERRVPKATGATHHGRVQHPLLEVGAGSVVLVHRPAQRLSGLLGLELCLRDREMGMSPPPWWARDQDPHGGARDMRQGPPCRSPSGWCPPCGAARTPGTCCGSSPWTWAATGPPHAASGQPPVSLTPPPWTGEGST